MTKTPKKTPRRAGVRRAASVATGSTAARTRATRHTQSYRQPKPKTAYGLLERVARHIEDDPRRYDQGRFVLTGEDELSSRGFIGDGAPPCGTVACRAGWIVFLNDGLNAVGYDGIQDRANEVLGMTEEDTDDLFSGGALHHECRRVPLHRTKAYGKVGAKGVRRFMRKHAKHLKARKLKDVPKLAVKG